jgi:DNA-binding beta-propeller fold protein YncE
MKAKNKASDARLLVLDARNASILSFDTEGNHLNNVTDKAGVPDGIAIDPTNGHIYWTSMGEYHEGEHFPENDGSIERINFNGSGRTVIIPKGETFTPKQIQIDVVNGFIYWSDREGMRVMRAKLNGTEITTLIQTGDGKEDRKDETRHCVGVAIDTLNGYLYWTQKGPANGGKGRIFRAGLDIPPNSDPHKRNDIELLFDKLPEPIDLEIDLRSGNLYWTDRGDGPYGNTLNRASVKNKHFGQYEVLSFGLKEAIGLSLDTENGKVYFTDLKGHIYTTTLDGCDRRDLFSGDRSFTGIVYVPGGLNKER